jgi:hypothetical protein
MQAKRETFVKEVLQHQPRFVNGMLVIVAFCLDIPFFTCEPARAANDLRVLHVVGQHHEKFGHGPVSRELTPSRWPYEKSSVIRGLPADACHVEALAIQAKQRRKQYSSKHADILLAS